MAKAKFRFSLEDESDLNLAAIDCNNDFGLNELNWVLRYTKVGSRCTLSSVLSHDTGKAACLDNIEYPILSRFLLVDRLTLLDTMERISQTGAIPDDSYRQRGKKQGADGRLWTNNLTKMHGKNTRADSWLTVACQQILKSMTPMTTRTSMRL